MGNTETKESNNNILAPSEIIAKNGSYKLAGGSQVRSGTWRYEAIEGGAQASAQRSRCRGKLFATPAVENGQQCKGEEEVGTFEYEPIVAKKSKDIFSGIFNWEKELNPVQHLECIGVTDGEVMANIQKKEAVPTYFVLPSQLNGAEYPSEVDQVKDIQDYVYDNTGGPRGQLAVHPAAGSFVLANAACDDSQNQGINAIDELLKEMPESVKLKNGYMQLPACNADEQDKAKELYEKFTKRVNSLRPLIMHDVPANGLAPSKKEWSTATHKVGLVYASAVPVDAYLNRSRNALERQLHQKLAEAVLVAQYYGSLQKISHYARERGIPKVKVYMLPLGGGVFNNPWESIARAMAQAVELMHQRDNPNLKLLQVKALSWSGNPNEKSKLEMLLRQHNKLSTDDDDVIKPSGFCGCERPSKI